MTPGRSPRAALERLANEVLEPIRTAVGASLIVTSGYRPEALNTYIGGSLGSDHLYGRAADLVCPTMDLAEFAEVARLACVSLPVRQCIIEFGKWLHVSIQPLGQIPLRQYLTAELVGRTVVYKPWEVA
jgi:hypothetical protein